MLARWARDGVYLVWLRSVESQHLLVTPLVIMLVTWYGHPFMWWWIYISGVIYPENWHVAIICQTGSFDPRFIWQKYNLSSYGFLLINFRHYSKNQDKHKLKEFFFIHQINFNRKIYHYLLLFMVDLILLI